MPEIKWQYKLGNEKRNEAKAPITGSWNKIKYMYGKFSIKHIIKKQILI